MRGGIIAIVAGVGIFILGVFIVPAGVLAAVVLSAVGGRPAAQFRVPGSMQVEVEKPGRYYLWNNHNGVLEGRSYHYPEDLPRGFEIRITNLETGEPFALVSGMSFSVTGGSNSKNAVGYVMIETPCTVQIEVAGPDEERMFSFSRFPVFTVFKWILGSCLVVPIVCLVSLGLTIWGVVRLVRFSNKKGTSHQLTSVTRY